MSKCTYYFYILILDANRDVKCETKLIGRFWIVLTQLCNLGVTLSYKIRLR